MAEPAPQLPRPGAPHMDNLIATILRDQNRAKWLNLDRIADAQGFDRAEFSARFAHLETAWEAAMFRATSQPSNTFEIPEGK
jgi:hypothetical protein